MTTERKSGADKTQLPRWRVRGTGSSGLPFELRIRAADYAAALRKASKPFVKVESCVLIESSPNGAQK